jgi:hypothetical protein
MDPGPELVPFQPGTTSRRSGRPLREACGSGCLGSGQANPRRLSRISSRHRGSRGSRWIRPRCQAGKSYRPHPNRRRSGKAEVTSIARRQAMAQLPHKSRQQLPLPITCPCHPWSEPRKQFGAAAVACLGRLHPAEVRGRRSRAPTGMGLTPFSGPGQRLVNVLWWGLSGGRRIRVG